MNVCSMRYHMYAPDLVDTFVVSEGTTGHQMHVRKPLVFDRAKRHFTPFLDKVMGGTAGVDDMHVVDLACR